MALFGFKNSNAVPDPYASGVDRKRIFIVVGLIGGVLIAVVVLLTTVLSSSGKGEYTELVAKVQALQKVTDDAQKRIRSRDLAKINSEFSLQLGTDGNALQTQLQKRFGEKEVSADVKKRVADAALEKKLTDAELLNKFDFTYQNLMRQKISEFVASAQRLKNSVGGKEVTAALNTFITNLKTVNKQLEGLDL